MSVVRSVALASVLAVVLAGCAANAEPTAAPGSSPDLEADDRPWTVGLLDDEVLGEGWSERALDEPAAGVLDGHCGSPDVLVHFDLAEVVRYERDAVVTHAVFHTDDAAALAAVLVEALEECESLDDEVDDARRIDLDVDEIPPTDSFRLAADIDRLGMRTDAVWAISTVDDDVLSIVGASVSDMFEDPADPLALLETSLGQVYRMGAAG